MESAAVLRLGRIEWVHPAFHSEQYLWPVGFRSTRIASSFLSRDRAEKHSCEVIEAPDGSGPLFRFECGSMQGMACCTADLSHAASTVNSCSSLTFAAWIGALAAPSC